MTLKKNNAERLDPVNWKDEEWELLTDEVQKMIVDKASSEAGRLTIKRELMSIIQRHVRFEIDDIVTFQWEFGINRGLIELILYQAHRKRTDCGCEQGGGCGTNEA